MDFSEGILQYVELAGVIGVFLKLDVDQLDEDGVDSLVKLAHNQIRLMVVACKEGSDLQRDVYVRAATGHKEDIVPHHRDMSRKKGGGKASSNCKHCEQIFYCRMDMLAHQAKQHPNVAVKASKKSAKQCPTCGKLVHNLGLHFKMKHSQLVVYNGSLAMCRQCEETYPIDSDHASVCRFSPRCPDCKKTFTQWRVMIKHRKVVHLGEKIVCPTCNKTFHDNQSLKKHCEAVHMKLKRVCPLCGATVTCLSTHLNAVHTDVRNFPCDMCDKKFKSNYDLTRHRDSVHLGNKAACPLCGKHISNLNQHIRIVHKQIKFPCAQCPKKYNTKSELKKHIKNTHTDTQHTKPDLTAQHVHSDTASYHHHHAPLETSATLEPSSHLAHGEPSGLVPLQHYHHTIEQPHHIPNEPSDGNHTLPSEPSGWNTLGFSKSEDSEHHHLLSSSSKQATVIVDYNLANEGNPVSATRYIELRPPLEHEENDVSTASSRHLHDLRTGADLSSRHTATSSNDVINSRHTSSTDILRHHHHIHTEVGLSSGHILSSRLPSHLISHPEISRLNPDLDRMYENPDLERIPVNPDLERISGNPDMERISGPGSSDDGTPVDARRLDLERTHLSGGVANVHRLPRNYRQKSINANEEPLPRGTTASASRDQVDDLGGHTEVMYESTAGEEGGGGHLHVVTNYQS